MTTDFANKTSLKVANQLPEFIRSEEDYETFVSFIRAYYEWMEQQDIGSSKKGVTYGTQNLLKYRDIDFADPGETYNLFLDYYLNDFLPNFPVDALADKTKLIKIARELYQIKGTPASYEFLFRALYNSDAQLFPTREVVLKASDGKWYISKSLRLASNDEQFLSVNNLRIFGETSKSIATIERGVRVNNRIELYISNIERLFLSGENIVVVDNNNQKLYFKDGEIVSSSVSGASTLEAKILGSISSVNIDPDKRGQLYKGRSTTYSGDPVIFYGGLNAANGIGATAFVNEVTAGSLKQIDTLNGSYGYREDPNTYIQITGGGGSGAIANVATVDPATEIVVGFIPQDWLSYDILAKNIDEVFNFFDANTTADVDCTLANAFTFTAFSTYALDGVIVNNGGGGYTSLPTIKAKSLYDTTDPRSGSLQQKGILSSIGILGPIEIVDGGSGYANGEYLIFSDGTGAGANANITVNATGTIISAEYLAIINDDEVQEYPKGGIGYKNSALPTVTVDTAAGTDAVIRVNTVLGDGAEFVGVPDERGIGAITSFIIENYGEDYISAPNVSLRVRDIVVQNVDPETIATSGEIVYQGDSLGSPSFLANIASISLLEAGATENVSKYLMRVFNYTSNTKTNLQLTVERESSNLYYDIVTTYNTEDESGTTLFESGIRTYGNGAARATARFLNGLIVGEGRYLNDDGFPSSFQVLENEDYNNFTYRLSVQKSFSAYETVMKNLLHPAGTKVIPTHTLKAHQDIESHRESFLANSKTLLYYTSDGGSSASMYATFENPSNNIIKFNDLVGANLEEILYPGAKVELNASNGPDVYSSVISVVDGESNTVVITDNVYLAYGNVAIGDVVASNDRINITEITNQFDVINNGEYSNTQNKLIDIAYAGDTVRVYANDSYTYETTISYVSYSNGVIFLSNTSSYTLSSANISIRRNVTTTDVKIYNNLGTVFYPQLTTEDGYQITTEDGSILIIG